MPCACCCQGTLVHSQAAVSGAPSGASAVVSLCKCCNAVPVRCTFATHRFVLLSDGTVPLFDPLTFYQQVRLLCVLLAVQPASHFYIHFHVREHEWVRECWAQPSREQSRPCVLSPTLQSQLVGPPTLPCTQVMFEERSRVKACASPDDMASRWKDAMQVSSCPTLGRLGGGGLCHLTNVQHWPTATTPSHPPIHQLPLPQRPALRKEHWRRSSPFFSLTRSHAQLAAADEEVFQS